MINNRIVKIVLAGATLGSAAYFGTMWMKTSPPEEEIRPGMERTLKGSEEASSIIQDFQHIESQMDKIGWRLNARKAELIDNMAFLQEVKVKFNTSEKEVIQARGDKGEIDMKTKNIELNGNVRVIYGETYRFYSQEIRWNDRDRVLHSRTPVRIIGPEGEITGRSLVARPDKMIFTIEGNVKVRYTGGARNEDAQASPEDTL
jgi:LPS export ABC transporter protein LptC